MKPSGEISTALKAISPQCARLEVFKVSPVRTLCPCCPADLWLLFLWARGARKPPQIQIVECGVGERCLIITKLVSFI